MSDSNEILTNLPEEPEETNRTDWKKEIKEWAQAIFFAVIIGYVIINFIFFTVRVDGASMDPTLTHGDRLIVWRLGYEPENGDIVVLEPPLYNVDDRYVKRVIATEGQTVQIINNRVYVNGEAIDEPYIQGNVSALGSKYELPQVIPQGACFVLGDNREHSTDSRAFGLVPNDHIMGEVKLRIWPLNSLGVF
ncbi:MAG: signal peptidase I [Clostridia bacterium]|nr:signal peptidase I [Clostridia bacterium]